MSRAAPPSPRRSRPPLSAQDQAAQFRLLADNVPVLIAVFDAHDLTCLFANRQYAGAFGLDEDAILGLTVSEVIGEDAAREIEPQVRRLLDEHVSANYERRLQSLDGQVRWIEVNLVPHLSPDRKEVLSAFVLINDITRYREAELAVRESEERMAKFMQASMEGIVFHRDGVITDANPALCELLGLPLSSLVGRRALDLVAPEEVAMVRSVMEAGEETHYETVVIDAQGHRLPVELIVRTLTCQGQHYRMGVVRDLRAQHEAMARIHHLAHHDPLTGLLNRNTLMERLRERLARGGEGAALLFIDLDNFKRVNDSLGHLEGDQVLRTVADRLRAGLRAGDLVARFGGDEFVVLLEHVTQRKDVLVVLNALLSVVEVPVRADGRDLSVTPSIGVALYPDHGQTPEDLLQHADTAMYLAKAAGRATYRFFEAAMAATAYADLVLEGELAQALTADEFVLFYQPQVDAQTGHLVGAEALLRWRHPERGLLTPDAFILVAERHRLMLPLGEWVMREAARQTRLWHDSGVAPVPIAVNLSSMQFRLASFSKSVGQILKAAGVPGQWLELELTERMLTEEIERLPELLQTLRSQGLAISIDDFGTGYTALNQLTRLPLDKLKIDQSFVAVLPDDRGAAAITRAMVQMAKGLGLRVGAEGVRNARQWHLLAEWGCDELQGEVIASAMPADEFEAWLAQRGRPTLPRTDP